jgi:hypothetical protein
LMTDKEARKMNVGGELICTVYWKKRKTEHYHVTYR